MPFVFDTSRDPIHLQVFPAAYSHAELVEHCAQLASYYQGLAVERPTARVCLLADARAAQPIDARGRRCIAELFERLSPCLKTRAVAHAAVVSGRMAQGALTAILWLRTPPWPMKAFARIEEAEAWIRARLAAEGVVVPDLPPGWWARPSPQSGAVRRPR